MSNKLAKKVTSSILISLVLLCTGIAILAVWDIISLEDVIPKIFTTLLIVFAASVVVLFIFNVLFKENE